MQDTAMQESYPHTTTNVTTNRTLPSDAGALQPTTASSQPLIHAGITLAANPQPQSAIRQGLPVVQKQTIQPDINSYDAAILDLVNLCSNPALSHSMSNIITVFEANVRAEAQQGKPIIKKSGRYNATDTIASAPEFRWPNNGYHEMGGRKRALYDELTMQEWEMGQLSNIYHMHDYNTVKQWA